MNTCRWPVPLLMMLVAAGCASGPRFDTSAVVPAGPARAVEQVGALHGRAVLWGGSIVAIENLRDHTRLQVLVYPLTRNQRPDPEAEALGRALVEVPGFLEPETWAPGRLVTFVGRLDGVRTGRVGEAAYRYPVVRVDRRGLYLWPSAEETSGSGFSIGVGVGVILGN